MPTYLRMLAIIKSTIIIVVQYAAIFSYIDLLVKAGYLFNGSQYCTIIAWYWKIKQQNRVLHLNCAIGMGSGNKDRQNF